jgi:phosphatidylinositol 3-kinase
MPPKMRITKEIIDGMGGINSNNFEKFKKLACLVFNILRRFSNLILLYFKMMTFSNIPHISGEFEENIHKVIEKNFKLEMTDDDAEVYMLELIDKNLNSMFPVVIDKFHSLAQMFKS